MDWTILFSGGAFGLSLVVTISGFVYLIMRLITQPMKEDLVELKQAVAKMCDKVKSENELQHMIDTSIMRHKEKCELMIKMTMGERK